MCRRQSIHPLPAHLQIAEDLTWSTHVSYTYNMTSRKFQGVRIRVEMPSRTVQEKHPHFQRFSYQAWLLKTSALGQCLVCQISEEYLKFPRHYLLYIVCLLVFYTPPSPAPFPYLYGMITVPPTLMLHCCYWFGKYRIIGYADTFWRISCGKGLLSHSALTRKWRLLDCLFTF